MRSVVEGCGLRVILSAPIGEDRYHIDIVRIDGRSVDADEWQMALDALLTEQQQLDLASEYDEGLRVSRHTCSIDVIR